MLIISFIYLLVQLVLAAGFIRLLRDISVSWGSAEISIVTAAKNEMSNLEGFIKAVKNIDYPAGKFELIIVDDNSVDGTFETAGKTSESSGNFKVIKAGVKSIHGKRGALLQAIKESEYPFIMVTDADCLPSPGWLNTSSSLFEQGYEFIFGPAPLIRKRNSFISSVSCMENLKNHFLSFSLASLGLPYTAAARNMGFSKEAFFKIGGYGNTLDTLSGDDDLLLREAVRNKLKIKAFYDKDAMVFSGTPLSLSAYLNQKTRHTQSSFHYLFKHRIILGFWHLLNLFMLFSPVLMVINVQFLWLIIIKLFTDAVILSDIQKKFSYNFSLPEILWYDIICEVFIMVNVFNALFRKAQWK